MAVAAAPVIKGVPLIQRNEIRLGQLVGKGQYGRVYRGICRGEAVAVKELDDISRIEAKVLADFQREVVIMSQLHHPNVVLLMGCCVEENRLAIVTELLEGNLQSIIHNKQIKLGNLHRVAFALDIARGMAWLHNAKPHQIIHRDLKLTNLLVDENWRVKVGDFGLSHLLQTDFMQDEDVAVGSALWMAPEVLQGEKLTDKIDVYSFGLILWELWSRKEPFQEFETVGEFRESVCNRRFRPSLNKHGIPLSVQRIIEQSWAPIARDRPPIEMLLDAIPEIAFGPIDVSAAMFWTKQRRWRGLQEVKYESLVKALCKHLAIAYNERQVAFACLKSLCSREKKKGSDLTPVVDVERFALVLAWFGPLAPEVTTKRTILFLDRMVAVMRHGWFVGEMEREEAEALLLELCTFLVRLNRGGSVNAEVSPFTVSKVTKLGNIEHHRVYHMAQNDGFFIQVKTKRGDLKQVSSVGSFEQLIRKLKKKGILRSDGGYSGQKYKKLFLENVKDDSVAIYLEADGTDRPSLDSSEGKRDQGLSSASSLSDRGECVK